MSYIFIYQLQNIPKNENITRKTIIFILNLYVSYYFSTFVDKINRISVLVLDYEYPQAGRKPTTKEYNLAQEAYKLEVSEQITLEDMSLNSNFFQKAISRLNGKNNTFRKFTFRKFKDSEIVVIARLK